jgi:hypothetical protein
MFQTSQCVKRHPWFLEQVSHRSNPASREPSPTRESWCGRAKHPVTNSCWQTRNQQRSGEKAGSVFWSLERGVFVRLEDLEF